MTDRGFTLVELLVTLAVLGILGGALARITINQSRYVSNQEATMEARQTARQAMNLLLTELRMVSDSGVVVVSKDSVKVRIPYAFGILCQATAGARVAALLPYDSVTWANAQSPGVAWRTGNGYHAAGTVTVSTSTATSACTADSIRVLTGGHLVALSPASVTSASSSGDLMYLYETVTYAFGTSTQLSGRRALFRRSGGVTEELLAPFDTSARFAFLTGSRLKLTTTVPTSLDTLTGLELRLVAASASTPSGKTAPVTYDLRPRVRFGNMALD